MRKNIKNDKVIKAITIGLATMIAATSAPLDVLATETAPAADTPATEPAVDTPATEPAADTSAPAPVADAQTTAPAVANVVTEIGEAAAIVKEHQDNTNSQVAGDKVILDELGAAEREFSESENLNDENLQAGLQKINAEAAATLEENVNALANSLADVPENEKNKKNPSTGYLEYSDTDDRENPRMQYSVPRDENDDLQLDEKGLPSLGKTKQVPQLSGQYDNTYPNDNGLTLDGRSVQGTYKDGMAQIQKAIDERAKGNTDKAEEYIAKAGAYLEACKEKSANSKKALDEAWNQYTAADEAAKEAEKCLEGVSEDVLNGAIHDTSAAQARLDAAQKKADQLKAVSDQWYATMVSYFTLGTGSNIAVYDEEEKLDVTKSAEAARKKNNNQVKTGGDLKGGKTYNYGRGLLKMLVELGLEEQGATDIKFGVAQDREADHLNEKDSAGNDTWKIESNKAITFATVNADGTITDKSGGNVTMASYTNSKEEGYKTAVNGRENHVKVTYTDAKGNECTKYFNYAVKGTKYEGTDVDFENGVVFVTEVVYDETTGKWNYTPYSKDGSRFLDNFNLTKNYAEAQAAVKEASDELYKLTKDLEAMQKVATNKAKLAELRVKLDKAQEAYDNSAKSLKDFQDLYRYMTEGVQPSDLIEDDIIPEEDDIPGGGDETTTGGDETTDGDDETTGGGETSGADGGVVFDPSTGTFSAPAYGFGSTILPGFTAGPATGVLGVRTGGGTEADEGGEADSRTNVAPRADFGTVNKVLGSRQNKDNSQIVKKIKDNEIPLAEIPNMDDEVTMNWMWLLIIFLLGATGKKMYDEYKKKKEAEEAAKINK